MIAPVAASGCPAASKDTNQISPPASRIVNPGATPASFRETTLQVPGAGPLPVSGPRATSSGVRARARMRLVNQFESGTSSIVLTLRARTSGVGSPGLEKRLVARSMNKSIVHSCAPDASCVSGSRVSGSSSRNRRSSPRSNAGATARRQHSPSRVASRVGRHAQNAALAANTTRTPSSPFASSTRSGVRAGP